MKKTINTIAFSIVSMAWLMAALFLLFAVPEFRFWLVVAKVIGIVVGVMMLRAWYSLRTFLVKEGVIDGLPE